MKEDVRQPSTKLGKETRIPDRTHKAYFPVAQTCSTTNLVLFNSRVGNVSL